MQKDLRFFMSMDVYKSAHPSSGEEMWTFEGLASTADVDLYDEVVYPENFIDTLDFFKSNGGIYFDHDYAKDESDWLSRFNFSKEEILSLKTPIGKPTDAYLTDEGLMIKGVLNKSHPMAKVVWESFLKNDDFASQVGLSIGAKYKGAPRREYDVKKGRYVTYLPDLLLYEVSLTPKPVNPYTWVTALKSLTAQAEENEEGAQYHNITPDSVIFDAKNNQLVIKSTIQTETGVHVFESYVDVKEGITNVDKVKVDVSKAFEELEEEDNLNPLEAPAEDEVAELEAAADEVFEEGADVDAVESDVEAVANDAEELFEDTEEVVGDVVEEGAEASLLDELVDAGDGQSDIDATTQLQLDKLDIIIDLLTQKFATPEEPVAEVTEPSTDPLASLKSVELSDGSLDRLAKIINAIPALIQKGISGSGESESTTKSVGEEPVKRSSGVPAKPNVSLAGEALTEELPDAVKSVAGVSRESEEAIDMDTLKSYVEEYRQVLGSDPSAVSKRSQVVSRAVERFNFNSSNEFYSYVRKADRGKF